MESSVSWNGRDGRPHHRRIGHLHNFRRCLSLLPGEESHRTDSSLVGLHAFHVTAGLVMLCIVLTFGLAGRLGRDQCARVGVLSLYWHFVDSVWVVVFTVVYIVRR